MAQTDYDVIIVGGGPGGLSAALYASRARLNTLVIEEKRQMGGQCATTTEMENYPGVIKDTGPGLMEKFHHHAAHFGAQFIRGRVDSLTFEDNGSVKVLALQDGKTLRAKAVILGTGTKPRVLGIPGEQEFRGKGVSYCATCDADFYTELDVVIVGSGNTAIEEAIFLTRYVNRIDLIVIHDEGHLDADRIAQEQAFSNEKIHFVWNSSVAEIVGDELVTGVKVKNIKTGEIQHIDAHGVFMFVGTVPQTEWLKPLKEKLPMTPAGYIDVSQQQETQIPGVFAVGDVCNKFLRQVVTAASDGACAAVSASQYIEQEEFWQQHVVNSAKTTLALFWSPLQAESVALMTELEAMVNEHSGYQLVPTDTYKNQRMAKRYKIEQLPTVVRVQKGQENLRQVQPKSDALALLFQE